MTKTLRTPWGKVQHSYALSPWLTEIETASHGGFKLEKKYNALIPALWRMKGGWYEEDCAWSIVFYFLEDKFRQEAFSDCDRANWYLKQLDNKEHIQTFVRWYD